MGDRRRPPPEWVRVVLAVGIMIGLGAYLVVFWSAPTNAPMSPGPAFVDSPVEPAYPADLDNVSVRYATDGSCEGYCPDYVVELCGNGTVFYVGRSNVNATGVHRLEVPRENVTAVINQSYRIDYFEFESRYERIVDAPMTTTSVQIGDETHAVRHWTVRPENLLAFEQSIHERSSVGDLVGTQESSESYRRPENDADTDEIPERDSFCH